MLTGKQLTGKHWEAGTDPGRAGPPARECEGVRGAALRYGDFLYALAGRFDGTWSYDQADLAVLSLPVLAAREEASAAFRLLLEDLGHYGVARKDRDDQGMTVYLEEFGAVSDGARAAIDLAERLRDAGVGVVFVVQSVRAWGRAPGGPAVGQLGRAHRPSNAPA